MPPTVAFLALLLQQAPPMDEAGLVSALNAPGQAVQEGSKSWRPIFDAYLAAKAPPMEVGPAFNAASIWPGMEGWNAVSDWAKSNEGLGKALIANQKAIAFGLPYGKGRVDQKYAAAGLCISVGEGDRLGRLELPYLQAIRVISAYSVAEMYRLGEAGQYDAAFDLGVANLRLLRAVCEQQLVEEVRVAMLLLIDCLRANREFMFAFLDKIPAESFRRVALREYPYLRATDNERLRRLQLPEGDRLVLEAILARTFGEDGQPDPAAFSEYFAARQTRSAPLERFGAQRLWNKVADVHGSRDASMRRLTFIYDDWWRRWRMNPYGPMFQIPTEQSNTNEVRYAGVLLPLGDVQDLFGVRDVLIAEINGTAVAAGICGHYREYRNTWPRGKEESYAVFTVKRIDFDPFDKSYPYDRNSGRLIYRKLEDRTAIDCSYGRVWATGCLLYAKGVDHEDSSGTAATEDASTGDLVFWPPLRALARQEGLLR